MRDLDFLTRLPVAHRGLHDAARGVVENTPTAIMAAIEGGYGVEIDVQLSGDGEAMVFHDFTLDRLTTGSGPLRASDAKTLKEVVFRATSDRMMTLPEMLALVNGRAPLLIELKSAFDGDTRLARRCVELMSAYRGPSALMSFDPEMLVAVRRADSRIVRGIVAERHYEQGEWPVLSAHTRCVLSHLLHWPRTRFRFLAYRATDLVSTQPRVARALGLPVLAWTVRTHEDRALASTYADQMIFEGFCP